MVAAAAAAAAPGHSMAGAQQPVLPLRRSYNAGNGRAGSRARPGKAVEIVGGIVALGTRPTTTNEKQASKQPTNQAGKAAKDRHATQGRHATYCILPQLHLLHSASTYCTLPRHYACTVFLPQATAFCDWPMSCQTASSYCILPTYCILRLPPLPLLFLLSLQAANQLANSVKLGGISKGRPAVTVAATAAAAVAAASCAEAPAVTAEAADAAGTATPTGAAGDLLAAARRAAGEAEPPATAA